MRSTPMATSPGTSHDDPQCRQPSHHKTDQNGEDGSGTQRRSWTLPAFNLDTLAVKESAHNSTNTFFERDGGVDDNSLAPPPECDASLRELITPLIAEHVYEGRLRPPDVLELHGAFAAISAVGNFGGIRGGSHYFVAIQTLAQHGFRRSSLVVDKLGLSICCEADSGPGYHTEQVDFPWSSISDIEEPQSNHGCAVTFGIREPAGFGHGPGGGLALVLRLQDPESAKSLADAAFGFKTYETQMLLWKACNLGVNHAIASDPIVVPKLATLLLDEQGYPFWSEVHKSDGSGPQYVSAFPEPAIHMEQDDETPCCNLCWC